MCHGAEVEREDGESPRRSRDSSEDESTCVKRQKLVDRSCGSHSLPDYGSDSSEESCSAKIDFENLKSVKRLNSGHDRTLKYVPYRRGLVTSIFDLGEEFKLRQSTVHRAVNYLDRLLSKLFDISNQYYTAFSTACLLVAAKFEEEPEFIPSLSSLTAASNLKCKQQLVEAEKVLLQTLGWNALSATCIHFSDCYMKISRHSDHFETENLSDVDMDSVKSHIDMLAKMCISDYSFLRYDQAILGAAIVANAREVHGSLPMWPKDLVHVTGLVMGDIQECYECVREIHSSVALSSQEEDSRAALSYSPKSVCSMPSSFGLANFHDKPFSKPIQNLSESP